MMLPLIQPLHLELGHPQQKQQQEQHHIEYVQRGSISFPRQRLR